MGYNIRFLRAARLLLTPFAWIFEKIGNRFFVLLAVLLILSSSWALLTGSGRGMQNQAYDLIMKNRFNVPAPHPDIVLVDIDEASLAAMAPRFGRWPWPRSVMADFVERLASAQPRAIVFDITFVDPDIQHPDADAYLREIASAYPSTFFSMIRLNPANDPLSQLTLQGLAGVRQVDATASPERTVAMIVPYFHEILDGLRMGTNNLYLGSDGIARTYHVYRQTDGWRIGSLPANVVAALGRPTPEAADVLLNWRGPPGVYPTHPFHPLYERLTGADAIALAPEFNGKIVIVGSAAASLFDVKPTPMSQNHPGFEILATALDNLYSGDSLTQLSPVFYTVVTALFIAALAAAFIYNMDYRVLNPVFTIVQFSLLSLTYLFLNYSSLFIDLTPPFAATLVYFLIAKIYTWGFNLGRNGHPLFSPILDSGNQCQVLLVRCALPVAKPRARAARATLLRLVGLTAHGASAPRAFRQSPFFDALYKDTLLLFWPLPPQQIHSGVDDLFGLLERATEQLDERGLGCNFLLDTAELTADREGHWRGSGRELLARALGQRAEPTGQRCSLRASAAFANLCQEHPEVTIPERLQIPGVT